jgi:hypothetical protein
MLLDGSLGFANLGPYVLFRTCMAAQTGIAHLDNRLGIQPHDVLETSKEQCPYL